MQKQGCRSQSEALCPGAPVSQLNWDWSPASDDCLRWVSIPHWLEQDFCPEPRQTQKQPSVHCDNVILAGETNGFGAKEGVSAGLRWGMLRVDLKEKVEFARMSAVPSHKVLGMTTQKHGRIIGLGAARRLWKLYIVYTPQCGAWAVGQSKGWPRPGKCVRDRL